MLSLSEYQFVSLSTVTNSPSPTAKEWGRSIFSTLAGALVTTSRLTEP